MIDKTTSLDASELAGLPIPSLLCRAGSSVGMKEVRQAHLPGNYEMYDPSSNKLGPGICRDCWENAKTETSTSLETVWVSVRGQPMVWWLCQNHLALLKGRKSSEIRFVKFVPGTVPNPKL